MTARRLRVLHVVESFATGPLSSIASLVAMTADRCDAAILHSRRPETPADVRRLFPPEVELLPWSAGAGFVGGGDLRAARELRAAVRAFRPDVIHAHSSKAGAIVRLLYGRRGPAVVYSPRGFAFERRDLSAPVRAGIRATERLLAVGRSVTVACGESEFRAAARLGPNAYLVKNTVPADVLAGVDGDQDGGGGPFTAVGVGGIRPQKNFPLFCRIAELVPDTPFLWLGDTKDGTTPATPPNVEIRGWLPRSDVVATVHRSSVFVQTSLWEGMPVAALEAAFLGLPILAMPAPGNVDIVVDGHNGFLCETAEAFAERLRLLRAEPCLRDALGRNGADYARREFDAETARARWLAVYEGHRRVLPRAVEAGSPP